MKYLAGFPLTLKCLTLNNLEMPFYFTRKSISFEDNYVKTNENTPILSVCQRQNFLPGSLVFFAVGTILVDSHASVAM